VGILSYKYALFKTQKKEEKEEPFPLLQMLEIKVGKMLKVLDVHVLGILITHHLSESGEKVVGADREGKCPLVNVVELEGELVPEVPCQGFVHVVEDLSGDVEDEVKVHVLTLPRMSAGVKEEVPHLAGGEEGEPSQQEEDHETHL
jgi:hypothetical protein